MRKPKNYINNKTLYENMILHKNILLKSIEENSPKPRISNYIGQGIQKICTNLAKRPNFSGYTYKDDMISDAFIDCIAAVDNFNPEKTNNPFAYFTQIAWNAFLRRIEKEKKQAYIKRKYFVEMVYNNPYNVEIFNNDEVSDKTIEEFETRLTNKAKGVKVKKRMG